MPGSTPTYALPYPFVNEAATPVSAQNLATAADTALTTLDTARSARLRMPTARAEMHTSTQSIAANTLTTLTYNTEVWDIGGLYSPGTPNRLTFSVAGVYEVHGYYAMILPDTATAIDARLLLNGATVIARRRVALATSWSGSDFAYASITAMYKFAAADFVQLQAFYSLAVGGPHNASDALLGARLVAI